MPLDRFFRTRIFDPLGMKDITFWPTDAQWPHVATVYERRGEPLDEGHDAERHDVAERVLPWLRRLVQHGDRLHSARHHAGQRRRVERPPSAQSQDGGNDDRRACARHLTRASSGRRLRVECARRHQPRGARHAVVRWHLWMVGRAGHAFLCRSQGAVDRRADGADVKRREISRQFEDLVAQSIVD